jgi:hypothetical protein
MAKKKSRIVAIDHEFRERIMPIFVSWGLERHPNNRTEFGRFQYGYDYAFADVRNPSNIKLCSFAIFTRDASLAIDAAKGLRAGHGDQQVPLLGTDPKMQTYRLARPFTLRRFFKSLMDASFRLEQRKGETIESAAARLIDDVIKELPRLKRYLYG